MKFPVQIQFRGVKHSDFVWNDVWYQAEKFERFCDRIISCHVVVSAPHHHQHRGKIYQVRIGLHLPGGRIYVSSERERDQAHEDVYVAIRDAFLAARRRLEDFTRKRRQWIKEKKIEAHGKVVRLFAIEGNGFILTPDQREIYFHKNAVLNNEYERLKIGDEVRFCEEIGEQGPQVTSMARVGRSGHRRVPIKQVIKASG